MSDFTIKNFKEDIEDSAAARGVDGAIEARFGRGPTESEHLGVTYFRFGPDYRPPFAHRHGQQEEVYVVISGSGRVKLDDEIVDVRQWDAVRVAPHVVRQFEGGSEGMEVIAIGNDRPEGGDGEVVNEFWTD
jgi:mannose-6-phosphate isomerase-like protein (cupin superfamily)